MNLHRPRRKPTFIYFGLLSLCLLFAIPGPSTEVAGQEPSVQDSSASVVLEIQNDLLRMITEQEVSTEIPIDRTVENLRVTGDANGQGKTSVEFIESEESPLEVRLEGTLEAQFSADAGIAKAFARTDASFLCKSQLRFAEDGFEFGPTQSNANNRTRIVAIGSRRGGCAGKVIRCVAGRVLGNHKAEIDQAVHQITEELLTKSVDQRLATFAAELNAVAPLDDSLDQFFPESEQWQMTFAPSSDKLTILAGPEKAKRPALPSLPEGRPVAPVQLWLKTTPLESAMIELVLQWK